MTRQQLKTRLFYTFCMRQHVCEVMPGTELHNICLKQLDENPQSAGSITLDYEDCLGCQLDASRKRSHYLEYYWDWEFCVEHHQHGNACPADCRNHVVFPPEITWGKYDNQMKFLLEP